VRTTTPNLSESNHTDAPGERASADEQGFKVAVQRMARLLGRYKRAVRLAALGLVVVFVAIAVQQTWSRVPGSFHWTINWGLLAGGFALLVAQELSFAFIWRAILARLGSRLDVRSAQQIYLGAEFVRYIPGNVWHVFTRILWAERRGVPRAMGFASMTIELATKIVSGALVFALTLLVWPDTSRLAGEFGRFAPVTIGLIGVPLLLIGLQPRLLAGALNFGLRRLGRPPVTFNLRYRDLLVITLLWSASWVVAGAGFYLIVLALTPPATASISLTALVIAAGIYAIGWDIGFLSFVTPSGLGFREAVLAILLGLSGLVTVPALALAIAVVARLAVTAAELVCVSGAHLLPGGRAPDLAASQQSS
jgi:glycosyltransferase 2 family protein